MRLDERIIANALIEPKEVLKSGLLGVQSESMRDGSANGKQKPQNQEYTALHLTVS